jgi:hypothetical protein
VTSTSPFRIGRGPTDALEPAGGRPTAESAIELAADLSTVLHAANALQDGKFVVRRRFDTCHPTDPGGERV